MEIFFDFIDKVGNLELCKVVEQAECQTQTVIGIFFTKLLQLLHSYLFDQIISGLFSKVYLLP